MGSDKPRAFLRATAWGIKPLYYYWDGRVFAFSSEIKALLERPAISAAVNESSLPEYLGFGYVSGEDTLFANIKKLMPGHLTLCLGPGGPQLKIPQYWDAPVPPAGMRKPASVWKKPCGCA